jgi:hypothetical protein
MPFREEFPCDIPKPMYNGFWKGLSSSPLTGTQRRGRQALLSRLISGLSFEESLMLPSKNLVPDARITQRVTQLLAGRGLRSPCRVVVKTLQGEVTLSGSVQYGHQKAAAVQVAKSSQGVKGVVDRLTILAAPKRDTGRPG